MRWKALFRRREFDSQPDTELRFHIEKLTEEGIAAGLTPEEARKRALLEFGGKEQFTLVRNGTLSDRKAWKQLDNMRRHFLVTLALVLGALLVHSKRL